MVVRVIRCASLIPGAMRREVFDVDRAEGATVADLVATTRDPNWSADLDLTFLLDGQRTSADARVRDGSLLVYGPTIHGDSFRRATRFVERKVEKITGISVPQDWWKYIVPVYWLYKAYKALLPAMPEIEPEQEQSPSFRWGGAETTYGDGYYTPVVVGDIELSGHAIALDADPVYVAEGVARERLFVVLELAWGPLYSVGGVKIDVDAQRIESDPFGGALPNDLFPSGVRVNDVELSLETAETIGATAWIRLGRDDQFPMAGSAALPTGTVSAGFVFENPGDSTIVFVGSTTASSFKVQLDFPRGLYQQGGSGNVYELEVRYRVEWRPRGRSNWTTVLGAGGATEFAETEKKREAFSRTVEFAVAPFDPNAAAFDGYEVRVSQTWEASPRDPNTYYTDTFALSRIVYAAGYGQSYPGVAHVAFALTSSEQFSGGTPQFRVPVQGHPVRVWDGGVGTGAAGLSEEVYEFGDLAGTAFESIWETVHPGQNAAWQAIYMHTSDDALRAQGLTPDYERFRDWADYCDLYGLRSAYVFDSGAPGLEELSGTIYAAGRAMLVRAGSTVWPLYWFRDAHGRGTNSIPPKVPMAVISSVNCESWAIHALPTHQRPNRLISQIRDAAERYDVSPVTYQDPEVQWVDSGRLDFQPIREQEFALRAVTDRDQALDHLHFEMAWQRISDRAIELVAPIERVYFELGDLFLFQADRYPRRSDHGSLNFSARAFEALDNADAIKLDRTLVVEVAGTYTAAIEHPTGVTTILVDLNAGTYEPGDELPFYEELATLPANVPKGSVITIGDAVEPATTPDLENPPPAAEAYVAEEWEVQSDGKVRISGRKWAPAAFDPREESEFDADEGKPARNPLIPGGDATDLAGAEMRVRLTAAGDYEVSWIMPAGFQGGARQALIEINGQVLGATRSASWRASSLGTSASVRIAPYIDEAGLVAPVSFSRVVHVPEFLDELVATPAGLQAIVHGDGVTLTWGIVPGADLYEVRQGAHWDGARVLARTREPAVEIRGLAAGERRYHVAALRERGGRSGSTATVHVTWARPDDAIELAATDITPSAADLIEFGSAGADGSVAIADGEVEATITETLDIGVVTVARWTAEIDYHEDMLVTPSWLESVPMEQGEGHWLGGRTREPSWRHRGLDLALSVADVEAMDWNTPLGGDGDVGRNTMALLEARFDLTGAGGWTSWERFAPQRRRARKMQVRASLRRRGLSYQLTAQRLRLQATT